MGNEFSQLHASAGFLGFDADIKNTTSCHLIYQTLDNESEMCWPLHVLSSICSVAVSNLHWQFPCYQLKSAYNNAQRSFHTFYWAFTPIFSLLLLSSCFYLYLCSNKFYYRLLDFTRSLQVVQQKPMRNSISTKKYYDFKPTLTACSTTAKNVSKS